MPKKKPTNQSNKKRPKKQPKKDKRGNTDLLKQYDDYCTHCKHRAEAKQYRWFYCSYHEEFMETEVLKECRVFCQR